MQVISGNENTDLLLGSEIPAEVVSITASPGSIENKEGVFGLRCRPPDLNPQVTSGVPEAERRGRPSGKMDHRPRARGGFQVTFEHMGVESYRAVYIRDQRTISINLDHPQLEAARGFGSVEDTAFHRLAYEVAFAEYAVALAAELAARDEYLDPSDPIFDIRDTLNRLARKGATLYSDSGRKGD